MPKDIPRSTIGFVAIFITESANVLHLTYYRTMIFDEKVSLVLRLYDLSNDQSQDIELSWTVLPYFIVPFTGRNMVIKFNTDIDNLNDQNLPRWVH